MKIKINFTKNGSVDIDIVELSGLSASQIDAYIETKVRKEFIKLNKIEYYVTYGSTTKISENGNKSVEVI
jgi:hypothetical protein